VSHLKAVYRMKDLPARTGLSRSFIYKEIAEGHFPAGQRVADNVTVWSEEVIAAEMERRMALYAKASA